MKRKNRSPRPQNPRAVFPIIPPEGARKEPLPLTYSFDDEKKPKQLTVPANGTVEAKLGLPLSLSVSAVRNKSAVDFTPALLDCAGDAVSVSLPNGEQACGNVGFTVRDAKGVPVHSGTFEHG